MEVASAETVSVGLASVEPAAVEVASAEPVATEKAASAEPMAEEVASMYKYHGMHKCNGSRNILKNPQTSKS